MNETIARANANVALVQSWGWRRPDLNLPYTGSISLTLDGLCATARWANRPDLDVDRVTVNGRPAIGPATERLHAHIDLLRRTAGRHTRCTVSVETNPVPGGGLGAWTAAFAALSLAGSHALGLNASPRELSILARRGTGSAARSVFGGFVEAQGGELSDGSDCYAEPLAAAQHWPLAVCVATVELQRASGIPRATAHDLKRSPFFPAWLEAHDDDLESLRAAVLARDLDGLGQVMEHNCLKARAVGLAATPPLITLAPATLAVIERVRALRADGCASYFTVGAGPHVTVLAALSDAATVADALAQTPGVTQVLRSAPGDAAAVLADA